MGQGQKFLKPPHPQKNPKFFYFFPSDQKILSGQGQKYQGQRQISPLLKAGQKYVRAHLYNIDF